MKAFFSLAICALVASAMAAPEPTSAPQIIKRQLDGIDVSAIVANPSSALAEISPLLANPTFRSIFNSVTADPAFQSSIQAELVSDYGSQSASAILQEYTSLIASLTASGGSAASSAATPTSTGSSSSSTSVINSTTAVPAGANAPTSGQSTGSNGAVSKSQLATLLGSAISVGAAIVLFV